MEALNALRHLWEGPQLLKSHHRPSVLSPDNVCYLCITRKVLKSFAMFFTINSSKKVDCSAHNFTIENILGKPDASKLKYIFFRAW